MLSKSSHGKVYFQSHRIWRKAQEPLSKSANKRYMNPDLLLDERRIIIETLHKCFTIPILKHVHWLTLKWHWALQGHRYTIYVLRLSLSHKVTPLRSTTKPFSSYRPVCYTGTEWLQNSLDYYRGKLRYHICVTSVAVSQLSIRFAAILLDIESIVKQVHCMTRNHLDHYEVKGITIMFD